MHGPVGLGLPTEAGRNERSGVSASRFHGFIWASGGIYSDFYIHIIDHCCWMKNAWPVSARRWAAATIAAIASTRTSTSTPSSTPSPTAASCSSWTAAHRRLREHLPQFAQGTKGYAVLSKVGDCGPQSSIYKGQLPERANMIWESKIDEPIRSLPERMGRPVDAIRDDKPFNEAKRGVEASVVTSMGRMAAHPGKDGYVRGNAQQRP